ncbi:sporulation protein YqfC [Halalkalibacterium halodurans]|uniref:BH1359 protein n=2 Tax=Halalkalibacterium halodurans TaxID=86665 RepID=Q9KD60_HALH5|nr:sporulation protein YqfC [Halalkalibacterium halodurans]MDY7221884.1 sporulation protein YqfC [Halalkalibacterium halodurans]MDY7241160.1 sporulation protein YqfC [Halalkalibacterium halodurans]MED3648187.1 sporulation protein YqfC [Halalkalibacterium halodurans]MED4080592.1 sporulation protein YqfC [Halalkalibacterium halodurans]MED4083786.1 sporulation protein YqfC [Halalkalibacterium halodurans]
MKNVKQQLMRWMTNQLQLPADVMMDLPRITMIGQLHIYIENHQGVLRFSNQELRLLLKHGQLLIKGDGFVIKTILPEELLLEGRIDQVLFIPDSPSK